MILPQSKMEIDGADVLKVILQHLRESGLHRTARMLQDESGTVLNSVESTASFRADILSGRWDAVLNVVGGLKLPMHILFDLHEHIVRELVELRETRTAQSVLTRTHALQVMKGEQPGRWLALERQVREGFLDATTLYGAAGIAGATARERRRKEIADSILEELEEVVPGRLTLLLGQALRWRAYTGRLETHGAKVDLLGTGLRKRRLADEGVPGGPGGVLKFGKKTFPTCCALSGDGVSLVTGSSEGFVEVWDASTRRLRKDLKYQAEDALMFHESQVRALALSRDDELVGVGDASGAVVVWGLKSGRALVTFPKAHADAVSALAFVADGSHLVSGAMDGTTQTLGLRSKTKIKSFHGHTSFITSLLPLGKERLLTGCADGRIRLFSNATGDCLRTITPPPPTSISSASTIPSSSSASIAAASSTSSTSSTSSSSSASASSSTVSDPAVLAVKEVPRSSGARVLVVTRSPVAHILDVSTGASVLALHSDGACVATAPPIASATTSLSDAAAATAAAATAKGWVVTDDEVDGKAPHLSSSELATSTTTTGAATGGGKKSHDASSSRSRTLPVIVAGTVSPLGKYAFLITDRNALLAFDLHRHVLQSVLRLDKDDVVGDTPVENTVLGILHHPHRNTIITWARENKIRYWE